MNATPNTTSKIFPLGEKVRWGLFRLLEEISELRTPSPPGQLSPDPQPGVESSTWIFVSTIGELNAIGPLIERLREAGLVGKLVFLTDHDHYREAYLAKYPGASFFFTLGASRDADRLCLHYPPKMLIIGEIPCLLSDAPCRFSYAFVRAAKKQGAHIAIVNGWLYGQQAGCRLDEWERRLLTTSYLKLIDVACIQTQAVANELIGRGLAPSKAVVTGNMKFDSLTKADWQVGKARSPTLLRALIEGRRDVIVVGCLRSHVEQLMTIAAFRIVRKQRPDTLIVLAHRHPEIAQNLIQLESDLDQAGLSHVRRTKHGDTALDGTLDCLVLDTIGELRDFYAAATITHVGADHNLLEPLAFYKPVTTVNNWHGQYPNFPIFELLKTTGGIAIADNPDDLGIIWCTWLNDLSTITNQRKAVEEVLRHAAGAVEKTLSAQGINIDTDNH